MDRRVVLDQIVESVQEALGDRFSISGSITHTAHGGRAVLVLHEMRDPADPTRRFEALRDRSEILRRTSRALVEDSRRLRQHAS